MAEAAPPSSPPPAPNPTDVVEALLFASDGPLEAERIRDVLGLADAGQAHALVAELRVRYEASSQALAVSEVAGGYRMVTRPEMATWLVRLARAKTKARLSRAALEALAIVGYKQPVSRPELDAIRGVSSEGVLESLLERGLIRIAGRKDAPGRPFLYETTREFLVAFGLRDLDDLPKVDGELKLPALDPVETSPAPSAVDTGPGPAEPVDTDRAGDESTGDGSAERLGTTQEAGDDVDRTGAAPPAGLADTEAESRAANEADAGSIDVPVRDEGVERAEGQTEQDPGAGGHRIAPGR